MRSLALVLAASLLTGGCAVKSYTIPSSELARLSQAPPETRGQRVRVVQDVLASDVPEAPVVTGDTQVVIIPNVSISGQVGGSSHYRGGGGGHIGGGGGGGGDGKGWAIVVLVVAATALVVAAAVEGSRFDGYAQLHPMHPVHLIGNDGGYMVLPLAQIDPEAVAWTRKAIVRSSEGPWRPLERAPLDRAGVSYAMFGGFGSLKSVDGSIKNGPAWNIQLGGYVTQDVGIMASWSFGWRDNSLGDTLFETRLTGEIQAMPVKLGILHLGLFGGIGYAWRFEDAYFPIGSQTFWLEGNDSSLALEGGPLLQLDINTRVAITGRLALTRAHDEQQTSAMIGLSVY